MAESLAVVALGDGFFGSETFKADLDVKEGGKIPYRLPIFAFLDFKKKSVGGSPYELLVRFAERSSVGWFITQLLESLDDFSWRGIFSESTENNFDLFVLSKGERVEIFSHGSQFSLDKSEVIGVFSIDAK